MDWIFDRAKERSTWATVLTVVTSVTGWVIAPELQDAIIVTALGVVSVIAIITKEEK